MSLATEIVRTNVTDLYYFSENDYKKKSTKKKKADEFKYVKSFER